MNGHATNLRLLGEQELLSLGKISPRTHMMIQQVGKDVRHCRPMLRGSGSVPNINTIALTEVVIWPHHF